MKIDIAKETVERHTTEEVLEHVVAHLKTALNEVSSKEDVSLESFGKFEEKVSEDYSLLKALSAKLSPKDPVVS